MPPSWADPPLPWVGTTRCPGRDTPAELATAPSPDVQSGVGGGISGRFLGVVHEALAGRRGGGAAEALLAAVVVAEDDALASSTMVSPWRFSSMIFDMIVMIRDAATFVDGKADAVERIISCRCHQWSHMMD